MGLLTVGGEEEEQLHVLLLKVGKNTFNKYQYQYQYKYQYKHKHKHKYKYKYK